LDTVEDTRQARLLHLALGVPGSGRLRYAAAMHFNNAGTLSDAVLEAYRICSPLDDQDPGEVLRERHLTLGVAAPEITPESAIQSLLYHADQYLSGLDAPGIDEVRAGLGTWRNGPVRAGEGRANNVVNTYLHPALEVLAPDHPELAAAIADATPHLNWISYDGYPPAEAGEAFINGHAFASVLGEEPSANIQAKGFDFGLFLIAPHVFYRDHIHKAPELYVPLTGPHGWRFGTDQPLTILPAHTPIWNEPFAPHMTKVGPVPFLCLFGWTRDVMDPATIIKADDWAELDALRLIA